MLQLRYEMLFAGVYFEATVEDKVYGITMVGLPVDCSFVQGWRQVILRKIMARFFKIPF